MGLFACTRCGSVDNTAFTNYSVRQWEGDPPLCSACDPRIGKWHGLFARRHWTVDDDIINRDEVTVSTTGTVALLKPPLPAEQLKPGQTWAWIHDEVWHGPPDPEPPGHWEVRGMGALLPPGREPRKPLQDEEP